MCQGRSTQGQPAPGQGPGVWAPRRSRQAMRGRPRIRNGLIWAPPDRGFGSRSIATFCAPVLLTTTDPERNPLGLPRCPAALNVMGRSTRSTSHDMWVTSRQRCSLRRRSGIPLREEAGPSGEPRVRSDGREIGQYALLETRPNLVLRADRSERGRSRSVPTVRQRTGGTAGSAESAGGNDLLIARGRR